MGTFTAARAKSGAWESVPTQGAPAGGGCASGREKGGWTHWLPDRTQPGAHARAHAPHRPCALLPGPHGQIPAVSFLGPSPRPPAAWPSASASSETQRQLSECSLPSTQPPPAPASHQGGLCLRVSLCQRASAKSPPRKPPGSAPGNPQLPRFPPMQIHGPASPTKLFRLIVHSFHPAVHSFVRYLMSLYPAGDQSGCCSRATNKTRHGSCLQQPHTTQGLPPIRVLSRPHPARLPRSDELGLTQGGVARDTQGTSKGANAASDACT